MAKLTRDKYPNTFKAFDDIIADNVASDRIIRKIHKKLERGYKIRNTDNINPVLVERFLSRLSEKNREILVMGDQDEAYEKFGKKTGYDDTQELLSEFFNEM